MTDRTINQLTSSITLLTTSVTQLLGLGGAELTNSQRVVDLYTFESARVQFKSSNNISVRVEYSLDSAATWNTLVVEGTEYANGDVSETTWQTIPEEAQVNDVLLRALGIGGGLTTTVSWVEFQFR